MKKYLLITEASGEVITDSCSKDRAHEYAEEYLRTAPAGTTVQLYEQVEQAQKAGVVWSVPVVKRSGRRGRGRSWTAGEEDTLAAMHKLGASPEAMGDRLNRTPKAVQCRLTKLRSNSQ